MKISKSELRKIILEELKRELANEGVMDSFKAAGQSIGRIFDKEAKKWDVGGSGWQELRDISFECQREWGRATYNPNNRNDRLKQPGYPLNENGKCSAEITVPDLREYRNDPGIEEETPDALATDASNATILKSIKMWLKTPKNQRKYQKTTMNNIFHVKDFPSIKTGRERQKKVQEIVNSINRIASSKLEDEE